jgi:DNA-binding XRE family transcriptional regulator
MDKRFNPISLQEQVQLRKQAVEGVLAHPEWDLAEAARHLRTTMRLTIKEMAKVTGLSERTLRDIESGRSGGTIATAEKLLGLVGLRLLIGRASPKADSRQD